MNAETSVTTVSGIALALDATTSEFASADNVERRDSFDGESISSVVVSARTDGREV